LTPSHYQEIKIVLESFEVEKTVDAFAARSYMGGAKTIIKIEDNSM